MIETDILDGKPITPCCNTHTGTNDFPVYYDAATNQVKCHLCGCAWMPTKESENPMSEEQNEYTTEARPIDTTLRVIKSRQILAVGYDQNTSTLRVIFNPRKDGLCSRYDYANVPAQVFADMKAAESVGKFFGANVKNAFEFAKQPDVLPAEVETLLTLRAKLTEQVEVANG